MGISWQKHKAIVFENDDWCGVGIITVRDRAACERALGVPEIRAALDYRNGALRQWSTSKLETPEEMQRLFDLLLSFRGADGRPVLFTPICLAANPDCTAIRENGFERFVDMSIADGFPDGRDPGDIIGKAKEGIELGVWYPQSHGRGHHYNGKKWVRSLREKRDKTQLAFFEFDVVGWPTPPWGDNLHELKGLEFDDMTDDELDDWFQTGMRFFRNAFGYDTAAMPITDARDDNMARCKGMLQRSGARIRSHTRGTYNSFGTPDCPMGKHDPPGVLCMGWNVRLDPIGRADAETDRGCSGALERIERSWALDMPAVVGGHRINYASFDENQVREGYGQTERLLAGISKEHPDAVYLTGAEVRQLYDSGTSVLRQGSRITCRNYTGEPAEIRLANPHTAKGYRARNLRTDEEIVCDADEDTVRFTAPEGEYSIEEA